MQEKITVLSTVMDRKINSLCPWIIYISDKSEFQQQQILQELQYTVEPRLSVIMKGKGGNG